MSAAEKIHQLPQTVSDLAFQICGEVSESGGDTEELISRLVKELTGRRRAMLPQLIRDWWETLTPGTPRRKAATPNKPKSERLAKMQRAAARLQRQIEREAEAVELVEKRAIARFAANATRHDLWKIGNKFGKKNCRTVIWKAFSERDLATAGIIKA